MVDVRRGGPWRNWYATLEEERVLTQNVIVAAGTVASGLLGVAFQVVVSHRLALPDFGEVFTVLTLMTFIGLPASAFSLLMARETSRAAAQRQYDASVALLKGGNRALIATGSAATIAMIAGAPWFATQLSVPPNLLIAGSCGIPFAFALPLVLGELQGDQRFIEFSLFAIGQAALKLVLAIGLGLPFGTVGVLAGISIAGAVTYLIALWSVRDKLRRPSSVGWFVEAARYVGTVLPSTVALAVLLSADVIVVKHYFAPVQAGEYAAVAALGRAIFWGASGVAAVLFPKVVFRRTQGLSGFMLVNASLVVVVLGGLFGLAILSFGSTFLITEFAGPAYASGGPYLPPYGIGMTLLGGVAVLSAVHQTRGRPEFLLVLLPITGIELCLLLAFHSTLTEVIGVLDLSTGALVVGLAALYVLQERTVSRARLAKTATTQGLTSDREPIKVVTDSLLGVRPATRPLRILILNYRCPSNPLAGGAERFTHEVARRLVARGHSVEWFSASYPNATPEEIRDGVRVVRAGNQLTVYLHAYFRYRRSASGAFDVVIDEVNGIPFFAALWSGRPTLLLIHQLYRELWLYNAWAPISAIGIVAEPLLLRAIRHVPALTVSASTKNDLRGLGFTNTITIVPEGIESISSPPDDKPSEPSFVYVGRLVPSKRVEHMLLAFSHFQQSVGSGRLWLVGSGPHRYEVSLRQLAGRLGIEDSVTFTGHVSAAEKHEFMSRAHALLMTSIREGWGLVVTEANACGTPAIVYDVPGLRDAVNDGTNGLVVAPHPHALVDGMKRIFEDRALYSQLAGSSRAWSSQFSFDATTAAIGAALEQAAAV